MTHYLKQYIFQGYYKHTFTFRCPDDGEIIEATADSMDIYKTVVTPTMTWEEIQNEFDTEDKNKLVRKKQTELGYK